MKELKGLEDTIMVNLCILINKGVIMLERTMKQVLSKKVNYLIISPIDSRLQIGVVYLFPPKNR